MKLLQSYSDGQETAVERLQEDVKRLLRRDSLQSDADGDMQGSSLMVNELEFKKMRQKKKSGRAAPQFGNSHLQDNENMLSLVGEIDEQLK